ncbi:ATP-binding protein [Shewanella sp. 0m-8]
MIINAEYQTHLDENLNNNPLCEAIHIELNRKRFIERLTVIPVIQPDFWELPAIYQQTQLRQLTEIHIPVPQTWGLYSKMISMILYGYFHRNPLSKDMRMFNGQVADAMRKGQVFTHGNSGIHGPSTAPSALVYGESGSGKTTAIRRTLSQIPQAIKHTLYQGEHFKKTQLVWVSFDLPPNGSPKAMTANFFRAVDAALGTKYTAEWSDHGKFSVDKLLAAMQNVASTHCLGLVHIDELQFMLGYKKIKDSPSLQILETLFNKIGIPIIQSSTQQGVELFDTLKSSDHRLGHDLTTVRRMLNDREFKFSTHSQHSEYFNQLFDVLFLPSLAYGDLPDDTAEFKRVFHKLTCGLTAIMTRLAHMHHETLQSLLQNPDKAKSYHTTFDIQLLNRVFKNQFHLIEPALISLRNEQGGGLEKPLNNKSSVAEISSPSNDHATKSGVAPKVVLPTVVKSADAPVEGIGHLELDKSFGAFQSGFGAEDE